MRNKHKKCIVKANLKFFIILIKIYFIIKLNKIRNSSDIELSNDYNKIKLDYNLTFKNRTEKKIRIGIYAIAIKNGGRARITSILINYFANIAIFKTFLFTQRQKEQNEYKIPEKTKRIIINNNLIQLIK